MQIILEIWQYPVSHRAHRPDTACCPDSWAPCHFTAALTTPDSSLASWKMTGTHLNHRKQNNCSEQVNLHSISLWFLFWGIAWKIYCAITKLTDVGSRSFAASNMLCLYHPWYHKLINYQISSAKSVVLVIMPCDINGSKKHSESENANQSFCWFNVPETMT